ncbi:MAG: hypothetical protein ABTQ34_00305 [Bdellovibrionales bacterium]
MIRTTVNDERLKTFLAVSAGLHLLFMLSFYIGLPVFFPPITPPHQPVPFEIVEIAEITNTRIKEPEQQEQPPTPPPPPPQPKAEPTPPPQPPQPKPPEPEPMPDAESLKPMKKPIVKPEEPKPQQEAFSKLLRNLETSKVPPVPKAPQTQEKPDPKSTSAIVTPPNSQAPALSDRLTISQEDALRRQISQCWNMPIGARDAQNLIVEVVIDVNPDRTVQHIEVVDKMRLATDSFFRAAAESAVRAINNPKCSPLELPLEQYEQWKVIHFTFDPRDML